MPWRRIVILGRPFARAGSLGAYLGAGLIVAAALGLRVLLAPWLVGAQFITFFPAVVLATYVLGTAAGILSVALSAVAATYVLGAGGLSFEEANSMALFVAVAAMDVWIISALRASVRRERQLNVSLSESEGMFRDLLNSAPDAMVVVDRLGRIQMINAETENLFGYGATELLGEPIERLVPVRQREGHARFVAGFLDAPEHRRMGLRRELHGVRKNGAEFPVEISLSFLRTGEGRLATCAIRDITDKAEAEERQRLISREIDHRANNLLTVVLSIATLSKGGGAEELRRNILGRIDALGRTQKLLSQSRWVGANLQRMAEEELRPYALGDVRRMSVSGAELALNPDEAQAVSMGLHELATNSAKYGALSMPGGTVSVTAECDAEGTRRIRWQEDGGPPVAAPSRRGLGTSLLERCLKGPLGGRTEMIWRREGLVCVFEIPPRRSSGQGEAERSAGFFAARL